MKKLLLIAIILVVGGCGPREAFVTPEDIQMMGNCEYLVSYNGYGNILAHKGDCKNPIHQCGTVTHDTIYLPIKVIHDSI